jgi:hypothetical protein
VKSAKQGNRNSNSLADFTVLSEGVISMKIIILKRTDSRIVAIASFINLIVATAAAALMLLSLTSCGPLLDVDVQPTGAAFFESTGGWDYKRIPLIEPYEAVSVYKETWTIDLKTYLLPTCLLTRKSGVPSSATTPKYGAKT